LDLPKKRKSSYSILREKRGGERFYSRTEKGFPAVKRKRLFFQGRKRGACRPSVGEDLKISPPPMGNRDLSNFFREKKNLLLKVSSCVREEGEKSLREGWKTGGPGAKDSRNPRSKLNRKGLYAGCNKKRGPGDGGEGRLSFSSPEVGSRCGRKGKSGRSPEQKSPRGADPPKKRISVEPLASQSLAENLLLLEEKKVAQIGTRGKKRIRRGGGAKEEKESPTWKACYHLHDASSDKRKQAGLGRKEREEGEDHR